VLELALPIGPVSLRFELGLEGFFLAPSRPVPKFREGAAKRLIPINCVSVGFQNKSILPDRMIFNKAILW
jgi:hypothetical protein